MMVVVPSYYPVLMTTVQIAIINHFKVASKFMKHHYSTCDLKQLLIRIEKLEIGTLQSCKLWEDIRSTNKLQIGRDFLSTKNHLPTAKSKTVPRRRASGFTSLINDINSRSVQSILQ